MLKNGRRSTAVTPRYDWLSCCCFTLANVETQGNVTLNSFHSQAYNNFKQLCHQISPIAELTAIPDV